MLGTVLLVFLMDFGAERYVEVKYGYAHDPDLEGIVTFNADDNKPHSSHAGHMHLHAGDQNEVSHTEITQASPPSSEGHDSKTEKVFAKSPERDVEAATSNIDADERSFQTQIAAFLILEFGVIFHSVIIGLNLGTAGSEFNTLYPVLVFHQSFEGLGIGARMSAIPFPKRLEWSQWALCAGYGLTTPIAIAIGLGLRTTYDSGSFTANVISGVLDAISAGILIYTGLVELLARDFLFNPERTRDNKRLTFMIICVFIGAAVMALLGKWA